MFFRMVVLHLKLTSMVEAPYQSIRIAVKC